LQKAAMPIGSPCCASQLNGIALKTALAGYYSGDFPCISKNRLVEVNQRFSMDRA
jgi:hypothetical protein